MMRSLSQRSYISELADDDYSLSSTTSSSCSKSTCRCVSVVQADGNLQKLCKRDSIDSDTDSGNCKENSPNQWHYLPTQVWKQTAEVKK